MPLKLSVLSPERKLLDSASVEEVVLTTSEGQIQILPGHAAMVGLLETGVLSYRLTDGASVAGAVSTGTFEIHDDQLSVLAETVELGTEIDVTRAAKAQKAAEDALRSATMDESQFRKYQLKLERSIIRQQIAGKDHAF